MAEAVDYFSNHAMKFRFPWRLYHQPILDSLRRAIAGAPGRRVLNVGSGPFLELERLDVRQVEFTLCDIDERAIAEARKIHGSKVSRYDVTQVGAPLPYATGSFDLVISMDVIEHLPDPRPWLDENVRVLKPGGHLFLTTPNYGSGTLSLLENTALEAIARVQGFSRKNLHPTKFSRASLSRALVDAGLDNVHVQSIAFDWVLSAFATKRTS
ncbi:MAG: methyltransferase domain-containing protein [Myxococcota bacterium]